MGTRRSIVISNRITQRTTASFNNYLNEIRNFKLLTEEEEEFYGKLAYKGDKKAIDILVTSNLRFVVSVAKQFSNNIEELQDIINEGNIGLQIAAKRFNPDKGFKFLTFGVWWVRHKINEYLYSDGRLIKLPLNKINEANEITDIKNRLSHILQREPSTDEILAEMYAKTPTIKYDSDKISRIVTTNDNIPIYLDRPVDEESPNLTLIDLLESDNMSKSDDLIDSNDRKIILDDMLSHLSKTQLFVIKKTFGLDCENDMTLEAIGDELGLTRERVRQIREEGINKLKILTKDKKHLLN